MEMISVDEYAAMADDWMKNRKPPFSSSVVYNFFGKAIGYTFNHDGWKYSRLSLNWDEEGATGGSDDRVFIKEKIWKE